MSNITKKALGHALKDLLRTKSLDKITIQDLTEKCGISRSTFYYHFEDIYALVDWVCVEDFGRALAGNRTYDTWENGFRDIFHEIKKDRVFIYNVYRYTDNHLMEQYLHRQASNLLFAVVEEASAGLDVTEEQKHYVAEFYQYGFVGIVLRWVEGGMKEDPDLLVEQLGILLKGSFRHALESYEAHNKKAGKKPSVSEKTFPASAEGEDTAGGIN